MIARFRRGDDPIKVDLRSRERRGQFRLSAERELGIALEPYGLLLGAVLELYLLQERPCPIHMHMTGDAPGLDDAIRAAAHRTSHLQRSVETRQAMLDPDRSVDVEAARVIDRRQAEPHLDASVVGRATCRKLKRIGPAVEHKAALAFDRPQQRARCW